MKTKRIFAQRVATKLIANGHEVVRYERNQKMKV